MRHHLGLRSWVAIVVRIHREIKQYCKQWATLHVTEIDQNCSDTNSDSAGIADIVASAAVEGLYHWRNGLRQGRWGAPKPVAEPG